MEMRVKALLASMAVSWGAPLAMGGELAFSENLLSNPSFEEGVDSPSGWRRVGEDRGKGLSWAKGDAYSGERALAIDASKAEASFTNGSGVYWRSEPAPCEPGAVYQSMGFLKPNKEASFLLNPLELVFFDRSGQRLDPLRDSPHNKEIQRSYPIRTGEWNLVMTRPLPAPATAVSVGVEFKGMNKHHFPFHQDGVYYYYNQDRLLLDNVALWKTAAQKAAYHVTPRGEMGGLLNQPGIFDQYLDVTVAAGRPPELPPGELRENSIFVSVLDETPGRIAFGSRSSADFKTKLYNLLSVDREVDVAYEIYDWRGRVVSQGRLEGIGLTPYFAGQVTLSLRAPKEAGAFTALYTIREGGRSVAQGSFSFGQMKERPTHLAADLESRNYPFMVFASMSPWMDERDIAAKMALLKYSGSPSNLGYQSISWFKPDMTAAQIDAALEKTYASYIDFNRKLRRNGFKIYYGASLLPGRMDAAGLANYELFWEKLVKKLDFVSLWLYGNETIGGTQIDPDKIYRDKGMWKYDGNVKDFFQGYAAAWRGAKKADPNCKFIMAFHNDPNAVALRHAYNVGGIKNDMFDGLAINSYGTLLQAWAANVEVLKEHGAGDKPLYVPEVGDKVEYAADIGKRKESELNQAINIIKYYLLSLSRYPTMAQISYFCLEGVPGAHGVTDGVDKLSPFTGFVTYCVMSQKLGAKGALRMEKVDYNEIAVWTRERDGRDVLVAWGPGKIKVKAASSVAVTDMMGNETRLDNPNGVQEIALSERPVFIEGEKLQLYVDNTLDISGGLSPVQVEGALRVDVRFKNNEKGAKAGAIALVPEADETACRIVDAVTLQDGVRQTFSVDLPAAARKLTALFKGGGDMFYDRDLSFSPTIAPLAKAAPSMDGTWRDWDRSFPIVLGQDCLRASTCKWRGDNDLSARAYFNWTPEALYFGAEVKDDKYVPVKELSKDAIAFYRGDAVEMGILSDKKHMELDLGQINGVAAAEQTIPVSRVLKEVEVHCQYDEAAKTIVYQARIPWRLLHIEHALAGQEFKVALAIPDKDYEHDGSPEKGLKFNDGIWGSKNPEMYGAVTLVEHRPGRISLAPNVKAAGFELKPSSDGRQLTLKPELGGALALNAFSKTGKPLDIELFRRPVAANVAYELRGAARADGQPKAKILVRWLDAEGVDLGAKAALFGFADNTMNCPLGSSAFAVTGIAQPQGSIASVCLRIEPTAFPRELELHLENVELRQTP